VYSREIIQEIYGVDVYIDFDADGIPFVLPRRPSNERKELAI
jgi:hypothetical protein